MLRTVENGVTSYVIENGRDYLTTTNYLKQLHALIDLDISKLNEALTAQQEGIELGKEEDDLTTSEAIDFWRDDLDKNMAEHHLVMVARRVYRSKQQEANK